MEVCEISQSGNEQMATSENECHTLVAEDDDNYEIRAVNLLDMPVEIILKILSFLDAQFLKDNLKKVCKRFEDILADSDLWKYWVHHKTNGCYPPLPNLDVYKDENINWETVCVEMDVESKKWSKSTNNYKHLVVKDVHYASVDTVLLINNAEMCVSGGRDRGMALWNIMDFKQSANTSGGDLLSADINKAKNITQDAHAGWIWDLAADDVVNTRIIYSASWDNTVKAWDITTGFDCIEIFRCGMSALSVVTCDNMVMAGLYSKKILTFDLRAGSNPVGWYKAHRGPVLALTCFDNKIASVSEDKTLAVWDRTAGKLLKNEIKIPSKKAYPVCVNWQSTAMYIGDSKGSLHLFNPENHLFVRSHEIWSETPENEPSHKIAGCFQNKGNIVVCSDRGDIKFLYNTNPPQAYSSIRTSTFDVTQLRYLNGVLVTGTCDSALEFWIPTDRYE